MKNKTWLLLWSLVLTLLVHAHARAAEIYPASDPAYALSLNGQWSFKYLPTLDAGADAGFTSPAVNVAQWGTIAVPSNWELQGHAEPSYADTLKDGLGLYRRSFSVPAHWNGRRTFLRFDGVAFGYEVWVNGKQAGASSASAFNRHTFDVTDLLQDGANVLAVRVTTKPLGYEFDLNDDWSLSGIYRDVTLLSLPALHVRDIDSTTTVRSNGSAALALTVQLSQPAGEVRAQLFDPSGKRVADALLAPSAPHRTATLELAQPRLWTAETPSLYRLVLSVSQHGKTVHTVEQRIGLRQVSVDGKRLLVNGKPIKLRGVNHHDLDPVTGRAVTEAQIRQDLALMKRGNVNYVRTAHYPPHPRLLELCDELGFYVMDEVAIGHGEKHLDDPAYRDNILARARATVARDKHHASVIIWSIGNENPISEVEFEAGRLVKQLDPTRPITYPKIGSYFAKNYERIPPFVDLYSPHYPSNATLAGYADKLTRPTILTEYAHALGLATDRMQDQWAMLQANPVFAGGSLWHFHDQGLLRRSQTPVDPAKPTQLVWRDAYQYYDTNGLDGSDGLVYADRTPQVDFWQMRKVYAPVQFLERSAPVQTGRQKLAVTLENRYDFRSLAGVTLHWVLEHNGKAVQQGKTALSAPAHQHQTVNIAVDIPAQRTAYADVLALRLSAVDRDGLQINERTLRLLRPGAGVAGFDWTPALPVQAAPVVHDTDEKIEVRLAQWNLTVQRSSGALEIRDRNGRVLVAGIQPHSGRRLTMAEALGAAKSGVWQASVLRQITSPVITAVSHANGVRVSVRGTYKLPQAAQASAGKSATAAPDDLIPTGDGKPAATHVQGLSGGYQLDINRQGAVTVNYDYRPLGAGVVAEAGLSLVAPTGMEEFRWIGQGPYAGYPGKDQLNEFGLHHLNRADLHFQGNRRGTTLAVLTDGAGAGMALATLPADVAVERHGSATLLSHNALIGGLGNKGTQPETIVELDPQRQISGSFTLLPVTMDGNGRWPAALVDWFGQPTPARDVYRPFFHSYDQ